MEKIQRLQAFCDYDESETDSRDEQTISELTRNKDLENTSHSSIEIPVDFIDGKKNSVKSPSGNK